MGLKLSAKDFLDWWPVWTQTLLWIIGLTIAWTKMTTQLNGLGGRVGQVEADCEKRDGRMDSIEKSLAEYRSDAQESTKGLARVEKGVDAMNETVNQGNLVIGSQIAEVGKQLTAMDKNLGNRLTRVETVQRIEQKLGPLPVD